MPQNPFERDERTVTSAAQQKELSEAINTGTLIVDPARRRPFYFDGRFLTASDLTADQDYVRARQSDLAQAIGAGVIRGLTVTVRSNGTGNDPEIEIDAGVGLTPAGDLVLLNEPQRVRLELVPETQVIEAQLGVKLLASAAARNRSGIFVLALRPVEYTSNPVASYPTTLDGARTVHDGDVVEATAITLIPYPDRSIVEGPDARRARVAREIFFEGRRPGVLQEALPLAMLYLEGGALRWLDMFMVRREIGAESTLAAGLNQRPRALLEAWLKQHQDHYAAIGEGAILQGFNATRFFDALPPVGLIPAANLKFDTQLGAFTLVQSFFPPVVDCEFAFVPSDEIAVLVDEALGLPPIDLESSEDDLDHLSILIVAPITRQELEKRKRELTAVTRLVRSSAPLMLAKRSPFEALVKGVVPRPLVPVDTQQQDLDKAWDNALKDAQNAVRTGNNGCFWYLRRRQLPYYAEISSATLRLAGDAAALDATVNERLAADEAGQQFTDITKTMPRLAIAETVNLLGAPRLAVSPGLQNKVLAASDLLRRGALTALAATPRDAAGAVTHASVLNVSRRFGDPRLGEGIDSLLQAVDQPAREALQTGQGADTIVQANVAPELDQAVRQLPAAELPKFGAQVAQLAGAGDKQGIRKLLKLDV
jgi:hypothetical protein